MDIKNQFNNTFLCGNVYDTEGETVGDGYTIIEKSGVKVAVIGMVTPLITEWDKDNMMDYTVTDPVEETRKIIDEINGKVDVIVAVEHMGENNEYNVKNTGARDLADACPEIDVIVAAHEHKQIPGTEENGVLIVENENGGQSLARVNLVLEKDGDGEYQIEERTSESIEISDYEPDEMITAALADADIKAKEEAQSVIGTFINPPLVMENEITSVPRAKMEETALIDLVNEVMLYYSGADIAASALISNTANLEDRDIRKCDIARIYKYSNALYKLQMTGSQLRKYMEWTANFYNTWEEGELTISFNPEIKGYEYDMFSGIRYEINISKEPGQRIENLTRMDGTEIKDEDIITIAVNDFRANSYLLAYGRIYEEGVDELPILLEKDVAGNIGGIRELIVDYISNVKNGILETHELTGNWKLTGYAWDEELHKKAVEMINSGQIQIDTLEDELHDYEPNSVTVREEDILK